MGEVEKEMKKTVVFEFQDDFKFPEKFLEEKCCGCPLCASDGEGGEMCFITGEGDYPLLPSKKKCPFYGGVDTINYDEC